MYLKSLYLYNPSTFCIIGINSTFNIGKFCVCNQRVVISLLPFKLEPKVNVIHAVSTDGEKVLVNALVAGFPGGSIHLQCFLHIKESIHRKLTDIWVS